jgi:PPOX class probable F420-dependent enzyme
VELEPEEIERLLDTWPVARLATLAEDGRPELVPIVFARSAGALWSPIDGKPKRGGELARVRNVRRDRRVTLLLDHYDEDWSKLWWLSVPGDAEVVSGLSREGDAAAEALRAKYARYSSGVTPLFAPGPPTLIKIRAGRAFGWRAQ